MKAKRTYWLTGLLVALLVAGCDGRETPVVPAGKVRVELLLPGSYSIPARGQATLRQTRAEAHPDLHDGLLRQLDDGTTLWLAVYEKPADNSGYSDMPDVLQSYVVRRAGNGYSTLYTCTVDSLGRVVSEEDEPLYLETEKTYKFRAVSPARKLVGWEKLHVSNGDYLLATDDRYTQTEAREMTIGGTGSNADGVTYVRINPLLHQTAQLRFTVEAGENVHRLEMLPAGIEVSGIQDDVVNNNMYNWLTSDPLNMYLGSKHSRITIKDFTRDDDGCITGQTAVLPTDATSNAIAVLLNLAVNGINSQYTLMLTGMTLEAARSYNFDIAVKVQDNVTVAVWQNQSWGWDMELK